MLREVEWAEYLTYMGGYSGRVNGLSGGQVIKAVGDYGGDPVGGGGGDGLVWGLGWTGLDGRDGWGYLLSPYLVAFYSCFVRS